MDNREVVAFALLDSGVSTVVLLERKLGVFLSKLKELGYEIKPIMQEGQFTQNVKPTKRVHGGVHGQQRD